MHVAAVCSSGGPDSLRCVCLHLKRATRSLVFANHTKHQHRNLIGAREPHQAPAQKIDRSRFFLQAPSYLENRTYDKSSRTHLVRRRNE